MEVLWQAVIKEIDAEVMADLMKLVGGKMQFVLDSDKPNPEVRLSLSRHGRGIVHLNAEVNGSKIPILSISPNGEIRPCYLYLRMYSDLLKAIGFPIENSSMDFVALKTHPDPDTYPRGD